MSKVCQHCGKILPVLVGMKFCPFCQESLASLGLKKPSPNILVEPKRSASTFTPFSIQDDDGDDLRIDHIQSIRELTRSMSKLDVEITNNQNRKETIGDIAATADQFGKEAPRDAAQLSPEQVIQEFQKEAGSLRNK